MASCGLTIASPYARRRASSPVRFERDLTIVDSFPIHPHMPLLACSAAVRPARQILVCVGEPTIAYRLGDRERGLPPRRRGLQLDPVDPFDPPVPAPAGGDQAQREAVPGRQLLVADAGGQQEVIEVVHREAYPVAG